MVDPVLQRKQYCYSSCWVQEEGVEKNEGRVLFFYGSLQAPRVVSDG